MSTYRHMPQRFAWLVALAGALAIGSCQGAADRVATEDGGGNLRAYAAQVRELNERGATKAISGVCASACTMFLGVKKVCVEPSAQFWFHAAHLPDDATPDELGSLQMLSYYPPSVRAWAISVRALESADFNDAKKLTGEDLIRMGVARCPAR